jgi:hypothetical protein
LHTTRTSAPRARQFTYPPNLRPGQLLEVHCSPWPDAQV